jgi:hypothetical protein
MKRQIIITVILLLATAFITVVYFKNLNPPGTRINNIMRTIPDDAALIFEFNNDNGFYDIFNGNKLLTAIVGKRNIGELDTLHRQLLLNPLFEKYFIAQNIFVSVHPSNATGADLLLTMSSASGFDPSLFEELSKQPKSGILVTPFRTKGKPGYNIYINALKKRFYVINKENNIFSGSFSKDLIEKSSLQINEKNKPAFVLMSNQQNANSLANLYINYGQLQSLFDRLFKNKTDIFASLRQLPGLASLTLNYRSDALMFNGSTTLLADEAPAYLNLFADQKPVVNHLKDIFPSTTAYSVNFSVSDPIKFGSDLEKWHDQSGQKNEASQLFGKINAETGISLKSKFDNLLANEFGFITTRYLEKFAVVSIKDGSKLVALLSNISKMSDESSGQLNYDKLPYFLLGDAFSIFRRPYFKVIDNYLILANSAGELASYYDTYINRKFLSKNDQYNRFDNLLAGQSNVSFFFHFKNSQPILNRDLYPAIDNITENNDTGWADFYGASFQLTSADHSFYTNFCMRLNTDSTLNNNHK